MFRKFLLLTGALVALNLYIARNLCRRRYHMNWCQVAGATVLALFLAPTCCLLGKLNVSLQTAFSLFFSLFCLALVVSWERFGMPLMPPPHRYHPELDLSLCLLGISLLLSILRFAKPNKLFPWLLGVQGFGLAS